MIKNDNFNITIEIVYTSNPIENSLTIYIYIFIIFRINQENILIWIFFLYHGCYGDHSKPLPSYLRKSKSS